MTQKGYDQKMSQYMARHNFRFTLVLSVLISLALVSFVCCVIAELKKNEKSNIKLNGKLCYLPPSRSFGFGIAALSCLIIAQIIGNVVICIDFCRRDQEKRNKSSKAKIKRPNLTTFLLLISWVSCGIAVILLSGATSMNRQQEYGKGWLDGECYLVKPGVFIASATMVLVSIGSILGFAVLRITEGQIEVAGVEDACATNIKS